MRELRRKPLVWVALIALASLLGISSRRYTHILPAFIATYAGDTLWALAGFLGFGLIRPQHHLDGCRLWLFHLLFL